MEYLKELLSFISTNYIGCIKITALGFCSWMLYKESTTILNKTEWFSMPYEVVGASHAITNNISLKDAFLIIKSKSKLKPLSKFDYITYSPKYVQFIDTEKLTDIHLKNLIITKMDLINSFFY